MLEVRDLVKEFGDHRVIDGVSVGVKKGEVVFLLGPSGAGKSTVMRCMNFLETPTGGEVLFHGQPVDRSENGLNHYRAKVGMVFQHFNLFANLTILDNITLAPVKCGLMSRTEAETQALHLLHRIGLRDKAKAYPSQLSGGQKQRVAIVRALAMNPEVLLFDEPTSALDPEMVGEVENLMRELAKDGMTMLVVSHDTDFAMELADRIVFLADGKLVVDAPPAVIAASDNPRIRDFFSIR
ncbi:MAG: amino acid ABC transporter ATP-binding protein [Akkermansia sp.]|nr:amino acid ABC transporter ATP-binding protein [Akkermansia sp.]MBQ8376026.1 amino acid ABC transporter ATP-binding protein [Akkermansia sp.]